MSEYTYMIVVCSMTALLFLGGWQGPLAPGWWWFVPKVYGLLLIMMWIRWTFPRVRFDQLLNVSWKWLIPASLLNLLATALVISLCSLK
jgi:NADH-quinone oxidoreductase subunit H